MKKIILTLFMINLLIGLFADQKGEDIARKNFNLKKSNDNYSLTTMTLINKNNERSVRKMESYSKEGKNGRNTFIHFIEPGDVKGTTFLINGYRDGDDEQRLYLPAFGKARLIAASNKDQKFMGSDLFYFDMEEHVFNDFTYKYLKDEVYDNMDCYVIEMYPNDKNSPYSKQVAWINKKDYFTYKLECYDKKRIDTKTKTIVFLMVKSFDGVLMPQRMVVDNHVDNHKTLLEDTNIKINIGLSDDIFTVQNMLK